LFQHRLLRAKIDSLRCNPDEYSHRCQELRRRLQNQSKVRERAPEPPQRVSKARVYRLSRDVLTVAQRFLVASPILFPAAALILRLFLAGLGDCSETVLLGGRPRFLIPSMEQTFAICSSILAFCSSKPSRAAVNISCEMVMYGHHTKKGVLGGILGELGG